MKKDQVWNPSYCRHVLVSDLCNFISGVPFDCEKDFGKDLRDFHAVVPARETEQHKLLFLMQFWKVYFD